MKRWDIINKLIEKYGYKDYLEIGLDSGICRDNVNAQNKTTVDPSKICVTPTHNMTSDEFFAQNKDKFDVVFIDGLHHGDQVLKDINNSLEVLREGGTILCHDMLPTSEIIQQVPRINDIWTGNCWQAWAKLRGTRKDLNMFIVQDDWGVGVIRKGRQEVKPELDVDLAKMDWEFFTKHKDKFNYITGGQFNDSME